MPSTIDLHTHSTASDGLLAPGELVAAAAEAGVRVLALTDHDTTGGIEAAAAALRPGMTLVPGAEVSCQMRVADGRVISMHVLAYLFDPAEPAFARLRRRVRDSRVNRAQRMVERLVADGHPVSWERIRERAGGTVGRPHIADALVEAGLAADWDEAFGQAWIGHRGRYWVERYEPDVAEALRLIHGAGGVSVFAHPFGQRGPIVAEVDIETMAGLGLSGIEVGHPDHPPATQERLAGIAADLGLFVTGSSDFHGAREGHGRDALGAFGTDAEVLAAIVERATGDTLRTA